MRADQLLVKLGLATSRTQAQTFIKAHKVFYFEAGKKVFIQKPAQELAEDIKLSMEPSEEQKFVSRGGLKLQSALDYLNLNISGFVCLDIGLSTGGFSDCLLQRGAQQVIGIDVGKEQLHTRLQAESKLIWFDKINARQLAAYPQVVETFPADGFDLIVMDVSFISMTLIAQQLKAYLKPESGRLLSLVKPQFELSPTALGKGGIVKDTKLYIDVETKIRSTLSENKFKIIDYFDSKILGGDGNREFFVFAK
ncbi:MAG: TlyA family RNA methyltransferase [Bdellovibrionia bacterium]